MQTNKYSSYNWMLRIEYSDKRSEHRLYKTESGACKAGKTAMQKYGAQKCRIFKEVGSVRQLSLFEIEPEY